MVSMTDWINMLKKIGCRKSRKEIRDIIINECLFSDEKILGAYQVDGEAVWNRFIANDRICLKNATERRIKDAVGIESWLEEIKYQVMRSTYPRNHHKKGR